MTRHKHAGLTKELHQRLADEFDALKTKHNRTFTKYIQEVKMCDHPQARKYFTRFENVVNERIRLSPNTLYDMREFISDRLLNDLKLYLSKHYSGKYVGKRRESDTVFAGLPKELFQSYRKEIDVFRATYPYGAVTQIMKVKGCTKKKAMTIQSVMGLIYAENVTLTPRKVIQLEGLLSREVFGEIAKYVFNHYEWPESLDSEVDRINLEYRTKGKIGRDKATVRKALYTAYALGV